MGYCQILRIKQFNKGSINNIGAEERRTNRCGKSGLIDRERTHLNVTVGIAKDEKTLYQAWKKIVKMRSLMNENQLKMNSEKGKNKTVMEQAVITASPEFFQKLGWNSDEAKHWKYSDIPKDIFKYFQDSINFMADTVGAENILSATIHFDETTPHLHLDYIPVIDGEMKRKDVYLKDASGKCIRDEKGHAIRARDEHEKIIYNYVNEPASINRSEFWRQRGGRDSYRILQDKFHEAVASKYGLERGQVGSDREHVEQIKYINQYLEEKKEELSGDVTALKFERTDVEREVNNLIKEKEAEANEIKILRQAKGFEAQGTNAIEAQILMLKAKNKCAKAEEIVEHYENTLRVIQDFAIENGIQKVTNFINKAIQFRIDELEPFQSKERDRELSR